MLNVKKDARRIFKKHSVEYLNFGKTQQAKTKKRSIFLFCSCYTEGIVKL